MQALLNVLSAALGQARAFVGLVLPVFANAADFRNWPGWLKALIQVALLVAVAVGLFFFQRVVDLEFFLKYAPRPIRPLFLTILFLLLVAFSWLAYGLWKLLAVDRDAVEFPDIQAAWAEATKRLSAAGLGLGDAPLFLLLGRPAAGLDSLFLASGVEDVVRSPASGEPPIRVYAWPEAIFVVCPGASAWAGFCLELTGPAGGGFEGGGGVDPNATLDPGGAFAGIDPMLRAEMEELLRESGRRDLTPPEQARLRELVEAAEAANAPTRRKFSYPDDERHRQLRRFRFLCRLIRRDRSPWCPINGVVVAVPWAATEADDAVRLGCGILEQELSAARGVFHLRYPTFAVVTDLEGARGFHEFRRGFRADMLKQRVGQRVPLVPVGTPDEAARLVGDAARWIGSSVLPTWILRFLKLEAAPDVRGTPGMSDIHNRNLYLLLRETFSRGPRLAELLARGVPPLGGDDDLAGVPMFGGCYLAATGRDPSQQAFVAGVFQRVLDEQDKVAWTPAALAEDARLNRLVMLGYVAVALMAFVTVAAIYWLAATSTPGR